MRPLVLTPLALLALTLPAVAVASEDRSNAPQTTSQSPTPTLQVFSRESVVDVTVTDDKGHPIHGLTASDFIIQEDGKPQPIHSFLENNQPGRTLAARPLPKLPANVYSNLQAAPANGSLNILLVDTLIANSPTQIFLRQELAKYLKTVPPGTQIALLTLGDGLRILQGFTSDPNLLLAAINDRQNSLVSPLNYADDRNLSTLAALRQIAAFVSGTKGRKNLLWFTSGMRSIDPQFQNSSEPDYTEELHKTYDLLSASQVAIYCIDPHGLVGFGNSVVPVINAQTGQAAAAAQVVTYKNSGGDILSMESIAESTGGRAFYNNNAIAQLVAKAIDDGANYYTLSYLPPNVKDDGRFHSIKVAVAHPGLHLVYRNGYWAEDPSRLTHSPIPGLLASATPEPTRNSMQASMARYAPPATQLLFDVKVAPATAAPKPTDPPVMGVPAPTYKDKPLVRYDLLYLLPTAQVAFAEVPNQAAGLRNGSVEFAIVAYDLYGKLITSRTQTMNLPLSPSEYAQFRKTPFQFFQQLDLPPGQVFLRIGVLDTVSNKVGTIEIPITVPKPSTQHAQVKTP